MSFYSESLAKTLQEKTAYFRNAGLNEEAELLQMRLNSLAEKPVPNAIGLEIVPQENQEKNATVENVRNNLKAKLATETHRIPELERQYILENLGNAKTLGELKPLRISRMERLLKISRASRSEKILPLDVNAESDAGPYNNEKTLNEALRLIYSQDPLWIEDLKELYFSIMPLSSAAATSKSPL